jgi:23S rRNA pseudouridine1911/1915/1917 synthase
MLLKVEEGDPGKRLDAFLHEQLPKYSRSRLQSWVKEGKALIGGKSVKAARILRLGEEVEFTIGLIPGLSAVPEDIPLEILYEDDSVVAINKPPDMVVHAGAGIHSGTVVNALLHRYKHLSSVGGDVRPGIVHRLDRFTSGVLIAARNDEAHRDIAVQFASRQVTKIYLTLVEGRLEGSGRVTKPITRDPGVRARMTAKLGRGRTALTEWHVLENFRNHTFLRIHLGTGRTHQIRAHMAALGHPVAGDMMYGGARSPYARYFLHAYQLTFRSPATGAQVTVEAPLPSALIEWKEQVE